MSLSTVTNNNRNWNSNKSLKVQLLLKKLSILAVINGIHVRYGECSWVYLFDVDDFSVTCVNYQAILCRILNMGFCDSVERIFVTWIAHGLLDNLSRSSRARQGWFSLKRWMCPSSDPSTATVSAQLLNELIIILLSKPSHAARIHLTISLRGGARMFPAAVKGWASPAIHSSYFSAY